MARFATLDIGTNSQLLYVAERGPQGDWSDLVDRAMVTRLGLGLQRTGRLDAQAMQQNLDQLAAFRREAEGLGVAGWAAVGTLCLRKAANAAEFVARAEREVGIEIEVISGAEEARLTYLGVQAGLPANIHRPLVFDLGGGSTEFILGDGARIVERLSLEVGAVLLTDRFLPGDPPAPDELRALRDHLASEALAPVRALGPFDGLVGVGGTATTLGALLLRLAAYDRQRVHGLGLSRAEVISLAERLGCVSLEQRRGLAGLDPKRADVILAGAWTVAGILDQVGAPGLVISDRGLRHGLMVERFGRASP